MLTADSLLHLETAHPTIHMHIVLATHQPRSVSTWKILIYPYSLTMWGLICCSILISALVICFIMSTRQKHNLHLFIESMKIIFRIIIEQPRAGPEISSCRVFISFFWLFAII